MPSSPLLSSVLPSSISSYCNSLIFYSKHCCSLKMSLNSSLFHFFIFPLSSFNLSWNVSILLLPLFLLLVHHSSILGRKFWSLSQKASNLNGLLFGLCLSSISNFIGQWSEPTTGRIMVFMNTSFIMILFRDKESIQS